MINQVTLIGRITKDVEVFKTSKKDTLLLKFTIVVNENNDDETPHFIPCIMYVKTEGLIKCLIKGVKIGIAGSIKQSTWTDKEGNKHSSLYVETKYLDFCEKKHTVDEDLPR